MSLDRVIALILTVASVSVLQVAFRPGPPRRRQAAFAAAYSLIGIAFALAVLG